MNFTRLRYLAPVVLLVFSLGLGTSFAKTKKSKDVDNQQKQTSSAKLDLNTASSADLVALPGIGEANAKKIIDNRPYTSFKDVSRAGVPQSTLDKIRPMVKVSRSSARAQAKESKPDSDVAAKASDKDKAADSDRAADSKKSASVADAKADRSESAKSASDADAKSTDSERSEHAASKLPQGDQPANAEAGDGKVWVNLDTKVYHREGDRWFGKTKNGKFMSESDAIKAGYHAAKNHKEKR